MRNLQLEIQMPELIDPKRAEAVAIAILRGGKIVDVSRTYGVRYIICRELVHKKCRRSNPELYKQLNIEAAHRDCSSPNIKDLQANHHLFINPPKPRNRTFVQLERDAALKKIAEYDLKLRIARIDAAHLLSELKAGE